MLYWQPILAFAGTVRYPMAEVLVRLHEEEASLMPPGEFLPVFEHYQMMPALDRWVVRNVVRHLARSSRIPRLSINISSQSLDDSEFPKAVASELMSAGVPRSSLVFEIHEADILTRLDAAGRFGTAVKAIGCGLLIDGFGRNSVSFAPLKTVRADYVKVDGIIVRNLLKTKAAETKLNAVLRVGEVIGFEVIAEMVEDQDVLTRLKALGVSHAQGFGIYRPELIASFRAA